MQKRVFSLLLICRGNSRRAPARARRPCGERNANEPPARSGGSRRPGREVAQGRGGWRQEASWRRLCCPPNAAARAAGTARNAGQTGPRVPLPFQQPFPEVCVPSQCPSAEEGRLPRWLPSPETNLPAGNHPILPFSPRAPVNQPDQVCVSPPLHLPGQRAGWRATGPGGVSGVSEGPGA